MAQQRILIIEDEERLASHVQLWLEQVGYQCRWTGTGQEGLRLAADWRPHLILLDLALPAMDGWEVCRRLRERDQTPIIIVTARGEETERVRGLRMGADDYIVKPFSFPELVARVEAVLRRAAPVEDLRPEEYHLAGLDIDFSAHKVWVNSRETRLTPTEFRLLAYMVENRGRLLTHRQILAAVWGPEYVNDLDSLRMFVRSLRQKIEPGNGTDAESRHYITTEYGIGYRFG
jgi:two-component system KDP operon response regulator KdpE